jgi:hypothetical protein
MTPDRRSGRSDQRRRVGTLEDDLAQLAAIASVGFSFPGTARSDAGLADVVRAIDASIAAPAPIAANE